MNDLQRHRGPDGEGVWMHPDRFVGLGHRRLAIVGLDAGRQPLTDERGRALVYNGEIYNEAELRAALGGSFRTATDTEVVLRAHAAWGPAALPRLRGMFGFVAWDEPAQALVCARDRYGIKPLYYAVANGVFYAASEIKAILPFLPSVETDPDGLREYVTFHCCIGSRTLFRGVHAVPAGHWLRVHDGSIQVEAYWTPGRVQPETATGTAATEADIRRVIDDAVAVHLRSDVRVGAYLSGGLDSTVVALSAARTQPRDFFAVTGRFDEGRAYDESEYAREVAAHAGIPLREVTIGPDDFVNEAERIVYHLDTPAAGPGAFPQFIVNRDAVDLGSVLLGGLGGDELFGGYARYLAAQPGAAGLAAAGDYTALARQADDAGGDPERRYFSTIDRSGALRDVLDPRIADEPAAYERFLGTFRAPGTPSFLERMLAFDAAVLLPALLHVEDRVAMAHGVESRPPLLDSHVADLAAALPPDWKVDGGLLKAGLRRAFADRLPPLTAGRRDKMGFPVPLEAWLQRPGAVRDFAMDVLTSQRARERGFIDNQAAAASLATGARFGRRAWALLSLELWQRAFHDRADELRRSVQARDAADEELRP